MTTARQQASLSEIHIYHFKLECPSIYLLRDMTSSFSVSKVRTRSRTNAQSCSFIYVCHDAMRPPLYAFFSRVFIKSQTSNKLGRRRASHCRELSRRTRYPSGQCWRRPACTTTGCECRKSDSRRTSSSFGRSPHWRRHHLAEDRLRRRKMLLVWVLMLKREKSI